MLLQRSRTDGRSHQGGSEYIYTKDLGYIDEEGYIYMLGRQDDVINYGGIKISPEEIESIVIKKRNDRRLRLRTCQRSSHRSGTEAVCETA